MSRCKKNSLMIFLLVILLVINVYTIDRVNYEIFTRIYPDVIGVVVDTTASFYQYILFFIEGVFIGLIFMYLLFSKFNKYLFKDVFRKKSNIVIFILFILIIAFSIMFIDVNMAEDFYLWRFYD